MMLTEFFSVFDYYKEAVIGIQGGEIIYCNASAKKMMPRGTGKMAIEDVIPEEFINTDSQTFAGRADVFGKQSSVVVSAVEDGRIISILPDEEPEDRTSEELLYKTSGAINSSAAVFQMMYDIVQPYLDELEDTKASDYIAMIVHSYHTIMRITGNISALCSPGRGEMTSFNIIELFQDVTETTRILIGERKTDIIFQSNVDELWFYGSRTAMERMLLNLLSNSLKYTGENGCVRVSVMSVGKKVMLTVSDNGEGIPPEMLMHVFRSFSLPADSYDSRKGIGIGLYLVQRIAMEHGGSAVLESRESQGTKVTVMMPVREPDGEFKTSMSEYESHDMSRILTELSDVLDFNSYGPEYSD